VLFQGQADWQQVAAGGDAQQNLFLRRMRLMFGATIANRFSFFAETDNPNLGKSTGTSKTISSGLLLQDAFFGYRPVENLDIWAGLIIIPLCRNCMQSATSLMAMDYGAFSFLQSAPTTSAVGRDTGFLARAYGFKKHLEVRLGAFQGVRQAGSTNGFRYAGRVQYSFGDPDVVQMFYGGSTFGAKRMVVVGGGFDRQDDYQAVAGDITVDQPLGPGAVSAVRRHPLRRRHVLKTLPRQNRPAVRGRVHLKKMKLAPYVQVAMQRFDAEALRAGDQTRRRSAVTPAQGNNANLKAGYLFVGNNGKDPLKVRPSSSRRSSTDALDGGAGQSAPHDRQVVGVPQHRRLQDAWPHAGQAPRRHHRDPRHREVDRRLRGGKRLLHLGEQPRALGGIERAHLQLHQAVDLGLPRRGRRGLRRIPRVERPRRHPEVQLRGGVGVAAERAEVGGLVLPRRDGLDERALLERHHVERGPRPSRPAAGSRATLRAALPFCVSTVSRAGEPSGASRWPSPLRSVTRSSSSASPPRDRGRHRARRIEPDLVAGVTNPSTATVALTALAMAVRSTASTPRRGTRRGASTR
jgi:hypothetical protein